MERLVGVLVVVHMVLLLCIPASADYNEVFNGSFLLGGEGWEYSESVLFNAGTGELIGGREDVAYDPWPIPGACGSLRQIIDNSLSPDWDPMLNHKIIDLWFDLYSFGNAYVVIGFDWWEYTGDEKPTGEAPFEELLVEQFTSPGQWNRIHVTYDFLDKPGTTWQPRWVSFEIAFFCSEQGDSSAVDEIVMQSKCVPEPSSLLAFAAAIGGLAGALYRRRR